jgi:hypothetical protein
MTGHMLSILGKLCVAATSYDSSHLLRLGQLIRIFTYRAFGCEFGVTIEAAADFTGSLSGLLVSLLCLAALGFMLYRHRLRLRDAQCQPNAG